MKKEVKLTNYPTLKITKVDRLKVEYVKLPVIDLRFRLLYRFVLPMETIWLEGRIKHENGLNPFRSQSELFTLLEKFSLNRWNDMCKRNMGSEEIPDEAKWLFEMQGADLIECEIKPK